MEPRKAVCIQLHLESLDKHISYGFYSLFILLLQMQLHSVSVWCRHKNARVQHSSLHNAQCSMWCFQSDHRSITSPRSASRQHHSISISTCVTRCIHHNTLTKKKTNKKTNGTRSEKVKIYVMAIWSLSGGVWHRNVYWSTMYSIPWMDNNWYMHKRTARIVGAHFFL